MITTAEPDPAACRIRALFDEHRAAVYAHALRLTRGDTGWAEDVVQETFLRAWRRWDRMTARHGSVRAWLLRVAHNVVVDGYRSARLRLGEVALDETTDVAVPEQVDRVLAAHVVHDALRRLPDRQRRALEATYLSDQTTAQAARQLDIPIGTVKSRVHHALRALRTTMTP